MPVNKIDYSKTIIYRIVCKDTNITDCYIGQTTDFRSRKRCHKCNCNNEKCKDYNSYVYEFIRNNKGWENFDMVEVEKYNAVDKLDSHKRERYWIEFYKANLNKYIPSRTNKERNEDNKEEIVEKRKQYYEDNKEEIVEKKKEYYENNKQQFAEYYKKYYEENKEIISKKNKIYCENNKEIISKKNKIYCENNKEIISKKKNIYRENNKEYLKEKDIEYRKNHKINKKDYDNQYREKNKELIRERLKETVTCECGVICNKHHLQRHQKSQKHLNAINNI
jgi:hypothetical protein